MMLRTDPVNLDPLDLQERMVYLDPRAKKEITDKLESQVNQGSKDLEETWVQWVFQVLWVNLDPPAIMDPLDFQVKWDPWDLPVKKENVVILAPWATLVSKVRRATPDIVDAGGIPGPLGPHVPLALKDSLIVSKCPRKILLMIEGKKRVQKSVFSVPD
jgi:hypothetical protein